jgi:nucleotide-binding universal stress UspA family protein
MSITKIVVGVDQGRQARDAAALGEAIATAAGADLLLVATYLDPLLPFPPTFGNDHRVKAARDVLAEVRPQVAPTAHTDLFADISPARALRRAARDRHASLLVVGSAHDAEPGTAKAGRTGRQVMHAAHCPVAFAASGVHERPIAVRKIVVGVDETPEALMALGFAHQLAVGGASVTAVAVAEDALPISPTTWGAMGDMTRWEEIVTARKTFLERHLTDVLVPYPGTAHEVRVGDPVEQLAAAAADADLLVVGSRRWGILERIALGSTSETLSAGAPCSLVVMPRPATQPPEPVAEPAETPTTADR